MLSTNWIHIYWSVVKPISQVSSSLVSRLCCSQVNQTKGFCTEFTTTSWVSFLEDSDPPKILAKLSRLGVNTVKLLQGLVQVLGTFSEFIGEQNLTRPSMLIPRLTLSFVTRNGFPPVGCSRWGCFWNLLTKHERFSHPILLTNKGIISVFQNQNITFKGQCESVCYIWRRFSGDVHSDKTRGGK